MPDTASTEPTKASSLIGKVPRIDINGIRQANIYRVHRQ